MVEWCFETSLVENPTKMPSSGGNYFFGKIVLMNINWSQKWSNFSFRSKGLEVWGDQALLLLLSNCIINMPHSLKWTIQSIVWINSRQIMAVLSCFALFLYRPDGRVSLQGYKKQENHNFTSSGAGTKCKTTAPGIYSITAVDNALTINLNGEKPDVIDRWPNCPNDYGEPNIADSGPKLAWTMKNTTLLTRVSPNGPFYTWGEDEVHLPLVVMRSTMHNGLYSTLGGTESFEHFFSQWFATCGCSDKFVVADVNKSLSKEGGRYFSTRSFLLPPLFLGCTVH